MVDLKKSWRTGWNLADSWERYRNKPKAKNAKSPDGEIAALVKQVDDAFNQTETLAEVNTFNLAASIVIQAASDAGVGLDNPITDTLMECVIKYGEYEGLYGIETDFKEPETHSERSEIKTKLRHYLALYKNEREVLHVFVYFLKAQCERIFNDLPKVCLTDESETLGGSKFDTHILNLFKDVYELVEDLCIEFYHDDLKDVGLFQKTRDILQVNGQLTAGINPRDPANYGKDFPPPTECRKMPPDSMVQSFFRHIPFKDIFLQKLPFTIPESVRFEHSHILAASGYGKTQLLTKLVLDDLDVGKGFCIIDSQGDLISDLLLLDRFSPDKPNSLSDNLVLIDAADVEYPACFNLFALNEDNENLSLKHKEILANNTIDLYTYIFSSLLGAELTARQGTVFVYIAKLMMEIPNASIITLRQLMEDGVRFRPYMNQLSGSAKAFFDTQFFSKTFVQTKKQILYRLWAVLSNSVLERMFSSTDNKINLFEAMNDGKIVLVNTSKQVLGKIGSEVMGKFFIAMLTQSALKRAAIDESDRLPFHVYIDEAWEYVDGMFDQFINQTRKYKVAFHLFHQNLDQLSPSVRASVMTSTAIKFAGGVSSKDAKALSDEMKTTPDQITEVQKQDRSHAEFSLFVRNITPSAVVVDVPFGLLNKEPLMPSESYKALIDKNRTKYCRHMSEVLLEPAPPPIPFQDTVEITEHISDEKSNQISAEEIEGFLEDAEQQNDSEANQSENAKPIRSPERGGTKHRYLQARVKQIANRHGFAVSIEKMVPDGKGYIDAVLTRDELKIACEISVTNPPEYESANIQKCLDAGFDHIFMVAADPIHLQDIQAGVHESFKPADLSKIEFINEELIESYLSQFKEKTSKSETTRIHGYKVNSKFGAAAPEQQSAKQAIVERILLNAKEPS